MPKGGYRKGAGRKATERTKTAIIQVRLTPQLKAKVMARARDSITQYITRLIEADLNNS